jgi:hypothetical protein
MGSGSGTHDLSLSGTEPMTSGNAGRRDACHAGAVSTAGEEDIVTDADVVMMNGIAIARSAAFARVAGTVLVAVGVVAAAAWVWLIFRTQAQIDDGSVVFADTSREVSLADRLDIAAGYVSLLVWAALAGGAGLGLRAIADYLVARTGGSLTGFVAGDVLPPDDATDVLQLEDTT